MKYIFQCLLQRSLWSPERCKVGMEFGFAEHTLYSNVKTVWFLSFMEIHWIYSLDVNLSSDLRNPLDILLVRKSERLF